MAPAFEDDAVGAAASRANRLSGWAGRLLLLGLSVVACVLLAGGIEILLRWWRPGALASAPALQPYVYSPLYGWALRSGYSGRTRDGRTVTIGGHGFRGRDPAPAQGGKRRVLLLGDSVTFGTGVEDGDTFTARLAVHAPFLQPINLGVSGYGTDQELLLLEREGFAMEPWAVVLNVCVGNDTLDNALPVYLYDGVTPKPYFTVEGTDLRLHDEHVRRRGPAWLARYLLEHSLSFDALLRLSGRAPAGPLDHDDGEHWGPRARAVLERWPEAVALSQRLVERVHQQCRARGVRLLVALHPNRRAFQGDDSLLLPFVPPSPPETLDLRAHYLRTGIPWDELARDKLGHLSPHGHDLAAAALAQALGR
ncbi:MAG TPA: SGNH/GDSL hydrolase family protein [Vicinamibacteria bacterium]